MSTEDIKLLGEWRVHTNSVHQINDLLQYKENDLDDLKRLQCSYGVSESLQQCVASLQEEIVKRRDHLRAVKQLIINQIEVKDVQELSARFGG